MGIIYSMSTMMQIHCQTKKIQSFLMSIRYVMRFFFYNQGYARANQWNIGVSHKSTLEKLEEMGKQFDKDVQMWKNNKEKHCLISDMLVNLHSVLKESENTAMETLPGGLHTTDISSLDLTFPSNTVTTSWEPGQDNASESSELQELEELMNADNVDVFGTATNILEMRNEHFLKEMIMTDESESSKSAYETVDTTVKSMIEGGWSGVDAVDVESLQSSHSQCEPPSYQVIGDNIDLYVKTKHMTSNRQNKSIHWFVMNAIQDRVIAEGLDNSHQIRPIMEVENAAFLPSKDDNNDLLHDFVPLVTRVLSENVPAFACFRDVVVRHIPHEYSKEMKTKSPQVST